MRTDLTWRALALGSAALLALGLTGCSQPGAGTEENSGARQIVAQVQIDVDGNKVPSATDVTPADPAGDGTARCAPVSLAVVGALTGPNAALGINIRNGAQLAAKKHNEANPDCQVTLEMFDTEGDPQKATQVAPRIIDDAAIVGMIGPAFSGETEATADLFEGAGLVSATASATRVSLSEQGRKTFFRGLANDGVQGPAIANYLKGEMGAAKVCVIDDSTAYGTGLADSVRATLGPVAADCVITVKEADKEFSAVVNQVKAADPDAVFFSGYYAQAAPLVQQLADAGVRGTFVSADGSKDQEFVKQGGDATLGAVLSCPCGPAPDWFRTEYQQASDGAEPGTYSTEGYDLATVLLKGIDAGKVTRPELLEFVRGYDAPGVARRYQWTPQGELTSTLIWVYEVK